MDNGLLAGGEEEVVLCLNNPASNSIHRSALTLPSEGSRTDTLLSCHGLGLHREEGSSQGSISQSDPVRDDLLARCMEMHAHEQRRRTPPGGGEGAVPAGAARPAAPAASAAGKVSMPKPVVAKAGGMPRLGATPRSGNGAGVGGLPTVAMRGGGSPPAPAAADGNAPMGAVAGGC